MLIPSGNAALGYDAGEYIVTSGNWIYSAGILPGVQLQVSYAAATQGELELYTAASEAVAICTGLPSDRRLQFRTYGIW